MSRTDPWLLALTMACLKLLFWKGLWRARRLQGLEPCSVGLKLHDHCWHPKYHVTSKPALPSHLRLAAVESRSPRSPAWWVLVRVELRWLGRFRVLLRVGLTGILGFHLDQCS